MGRHLNMHGRVKNAPRGTGETDITSTLLLSNPRSCGHFFSLSRFRSPSKTKMAACQTPRSTAATTGRIVRHGKIVVIHWHLSVWMSDCETAPKTGRYSNVRYSQSNFGESGWFLTKFRAFSLPLCCFL